MRSRATTGGLVAVGMTAVVTGCASGTTPRLQSLDPPTPTPSSRAAESVPGGRPGSPAGTLDAAPVAASRTAAVRSDPQAARRDAVTAYLSYWRTRAEAEKDPPDDYDLEPQADYRRYSFDPWVRQTNVWIGTLAANNGAMRGTPPTPRPKVDALDLAAEPYPAVVLTDCPRPSASWKGYDTETGKLLTKINLPGAAPYPHRTVTTMIYAEEHWGVEQMTFDRSATCTP